MEQHTHYVKGFTRRDEHGHEETACGQFVGASQVAPLGYTPTCWGCAMWLHSLDHPHTTPTERCSTVCAVKWRSIRAPSARPSPAALPR